MFNHHVSSSRYRIKSVAAITGLSSHSIRKWEKRYSLFRLERGANGYRTFTEEDIQFLLFLKSQLDTGQTIGQLAQTGTGALRETMNALPLNLESIPLSFRREAQELVQAGRNHDIQTITGHLTTWVEHHGWEHALIQIIFPVLQVVGDLWHQGGLSISAEHHISQSVRQHLLSALQASATNSSAQAVVACVPGDYHEIGPLATTLLLQQQGWNSLYLGPNASFEVLQVALRRRQAKLMILSCILEPPDETMKKWIDTITQDLQPMCHVIVGGTGFAKYAEELATHNIFYLRTIQECKGIANPSSTLLHSPISPPSHVQCSVSS